MNLCFFIGKVVSDVRFDFLLNSKDISIAIFEVELSNKSIIKIKAYNDLADYCYRILQKGEIACIYGEINSNGEIELIVMC